MAQNPIQWFPGHMAKTKRIMKECLPEVDLVVELLDARIPRSSENPDIDTLLAGKPRLFVLTKSSLADPGATDMWCRHLTGRGVAALAIDALTGEGIGALRARVSALTQDKTVRWQERGMGGRHIKAMIVGIPNVGKSSLINCLAKGKKTKVENRPGVTLAKQWVPTSVGLTLLDMPGVLAPRFDTEETAENLALTGAIRDEILDCETLAVILCRRLRQTAPDLLCARYKLPAAAWEEEDDFGIFCRIGRERGFLMSGADVDQTRTARMLLDEFRSAKIGRITLERPEK